MAECWRVVVRRPEELRRLLAIAHRARFHHGLGINDEAQQHAVCGHTYRVRLAILGPRPFDAALARHDGLAAALERGILVRLRRPARRALELGVAARRAVEQSHLLGL